MTDPVVAWVGCLVLVVSPEPLSAPVAEAVLRVEQTIYDDPVYVDAARVATTGLDDPLSGDLDTIAFTLYRELVFWGASPARNPAPRATFCVLVVHSDPREPDRLINALANTPRLGELPILFRTAIVDVRGAEAGDAGPSSELIPLIIDAIDATAHEVDRTPDFSLDVDRLSRMSVNTPMAPDSPPAFEQQPREPPVEDPLMVAEIEEQATRETRPTPATPAPEEDGAKLSLSNLMPSSVLDRSRELLARRKLPSTSVEVIKDLSARTDRVLLLYLVFASEPVKPPRLERKARADFAYELARSLLSTKGEGNPEPWYVRAFSAGERLRPGRPLPASELLRHRDFPDRWGEHFDLFDAAHDITEAIGRDRSSFRRRGVDATRTAVVFVAGSVPHVGEDTKTRLTTLCSIATVAWVCFGRGSTAEEDQQSFELAGAHVLRHHEDLVDELLRVVESPAPPDDEDELTVVPTGPSAPGER